MEVKVRYKDRELSFTAGDQKGDGLDELISYLGKNKDGVSRLEIAGESGSYTFLRQIYLLANMIAALSSIAVYLNSQRVESSEPIFPTYP